MLLHQPSDLPYLLQRVRSRRSVWSSASLHQALPRPVIPLQPLVQRLTADLVPYCRFRCVPMPQVILQKPLTRMCFLCYPVHAESLSCDSWVSQLYSITWLSVFISSLLPFYCTKTEKSGDRPFSDLSLLCKILCSAIQWVMLLQSPYFTVTFTVALTPLFAMTVIVQVPFPTALTLPFLSTVATFLSLLK